MIQNTRIKNDLNAAAVWWLARQPETAVKQKSRTASRSKRLLERRGVSELGRHWASQVEGDAGFKGRWACSSSGQVPISTYVTAVSVSWF